MKKKKHKNRFEKADVVITIDADPFADITTPGVYQLQDLVRGVVETIEVASDGARRVIKSVSLGLPDRSEIGKGFRVTEPFEVRELAIGELYDPRQSEWPEGTHVDILPSGILLTVFLDTPTSAEVKRMQLGRFAMRLLTGRHTLLFLARFGDSPWADAPYSVHRIPEQFSSCPPDPGEGYGWLLMAAMVDARTGIVRGLRELALSRRFSCAILRAFEKQKALPADDAVHVREVIWFQRKSTNSLASDAIDRFETGDTAS